MINSAVMHIGVHVLFEIMFIFSFPAICLGVGLLGHVIYVMHLVF